MKKEQNILDVIVQEYTDQHSLRDGEFTYLDYMKRVGCAKRTAFMRLSKLVQEGVLEKREVHLGYSNTYAYREAKKK